MRFLYLQAIEQADGILHHIHSVRIAIVRFLAFSMAAIINGDHLESVREPFDHARGTPLVLGVKAESMDQENRLAFALNGVMDLHSGGIEKEIFGARERNEENKENKNKQNMSFDYFRLMPH
jgi:hypothetical protein